MQEDWIGKAELFEALSLAYQYCQKETVEALSSGDYADALCEAVVATGIGEGLASEVREKLASYRGADVEPLFHALRVENTRLFIGAPHAAVSPYAGIWYAEDVGVPPVLYVNKESMAVERFMESCGAARPEGTNEPLDHIGTELEFLAYLCLDRAGAVNKDADVVPEGSYERFYGERFILFAKRFAEAVDRNSDEPLLHAAGAVLRALPEEAL